MVRLRGFPRSAIKFEVPKAKETKLRHKVEIYVPADTEVQRLVAHAVFKKFCSFFGGATMTVANGGWIDADGALIEDKIAIIHSFVKSIDGSVRKLVRIQAHQVQISLEVSEVPYKEYEEMNYTTRR